MVLGTLRDGQSEKCSQRQAAHEWEFVESRSYWKFADLRAAVVCANLAGSRRLQAETLGHPLGLVQVPTFASSADAVRGSGVDL